MQSININTAPSLSPAAGSRKDHSSIPSSMVGIKEMAPPPTDSELKKAIEISNAALKQIASSLEFTQDASTGKELIRIYDRETKELIRQFPTEEMVAISKAIDNFKGLLIHQKA